MANFQELEESEGIRLTWNIWPHSRVGAAKSVIPFAARYTPNKKMSNMPVLPYEPILCRSCNAVLNPYAQVDFNSKLWNCPLCHQRNHFPAHYQGMSETNLPAELFPNYTVIEYTLPRGPGPSAPPIYVFIVDTAVALESELDACKTALLQALQIMPENAIVGLVTYGTHVQVHELGFTECSKSYVFRGSKEYTSEQIIDNLNISQNKLRAMQQQQQQMGGSSGMPGHPTSYMATHQQSPYQLNGSSMPSDFPLQGFLVPLSQCEFQITEILDDLQKDPFSPISEHRPSKCTGTAILVAASMMRACAPKFHKTARLMLLVAGPSTEGPGKIVNKDLAEGIRSHKDLEKDNTPHFRPANRFYTNLADQIVNQGHSFDMFVCSLEQVGLAEMKDLVERTGGMILQTDSYTNPIFKESFKRIFVKEGEEGYMEMSSHATIEVIPSRDIRIAGLIGPAAKKAHKTNSVSDNEIGVGGTTIWSLNSLNEQTTVTIVFDITASGKKDYQTGSSQLYLQFITKYQHSKGDMRCRVTTISRNWTGDDNIHDLIAAFDQETACVVMAQISGFKMESEEDFDATRWLDRSLIRMAARFGEYRKDDPHSFSLKNEMALYPQFMFNLRRSQFVQVFGYSPDETAYVRVMLNRVPTTEAMVMIQPMLLSYSFENIGEPVLLDVQSIQPDKILLLDAYFYIVVFHGATVAAWRAEGYHQLEEHKAFADLIAAPDIESKKIAKRRFPVPRIVNCDQDQSQSRFLLARLNPSATYNSTQVLSSEVLMTDDVNLDVFLEHLKKLSVQS